MSNTVITNYTDLNGPSTKADSSVVVIVNKDGSLSVDQNLLGTLMGTDGSQAAAISVVRVGHEGRPDDATDSETEDDKVPHVTLSVDSYYDEPNSIIKYDSGAEMLQSLRIETRENSLLGFQNDHCYTSLTSPSRDLPQHNESFTGYDEPVIEITHAPPPKLLPSSKKVTVLEQQIIPKGRKIVVNSSDPSVILKGNDVLNKNLPSVTKTKKTQAKKVIPACDENNESSSISSSGDSVPDRDSDSDYKEMKEKENPRTRKAKIKPRILKNQTARTTNQKVVARIKANKSIIKKEIKEKIQSKNVTSEKKVSEPIIQKEIVTDVSSDNIKSTPKQVGKQVKKEKKTPAHVTALLTDMTSLFSTPDVIRRVSTENKTSQKSDTKECPAKKNISDITQHVDSNEEKSESENLKQSLPTKTYSKQKENATANDKISKGYDLIPQLDDASLAQIFQDPPVIATKNPSTITTTNAMNSPGLTGALSPTLDILGGLQPEEEGLTEDLLMHVAQLVESSENLQEVIDKQVLGKVDISVKTPLQSSFQGQGQSSDQAYLQVPAKTEKTVIKKDPIEIVRRDGRVITLPPIEAPATRASKRKSQMEASASTEPAPSTTSLPLPIPMTPEPQIPHVSKQYINKKLVNKKQEPEPSVDDKLFTESQESWNSEDDPYRLWCICKQPHNNRFMICCDGCEDWFHGKCVNITKAMGQQMEEQGIEWRCPNCIKKVKPSAPKSINKNVMQKKLDISEKPVQEKASPLQPSPAVVKGYQALGAKPNCIVCKKSARVSSIYCSDACILKHAQDSLGNNSAPAKDEAEKLQDKQKAESRVIVYERKSGRLLAGPNAPTAENLKAWLQKNPTFEVVRPGTLSTIKPNLNSKKLLNEPSKIQTTLNFERIPKKINQTQIPKRMSLENKEITTKVAPLKELKSPPPTKLVSQPRTPVTPKVQPAPLLPETPKPSTSTAKHVIEPKKLIRTSRSQSAHEKSVSVSPATPKRRDTPDNKNKMNSSTEPVRENVRKALQEQLTIRMSENKGSKFKEQEIQQFSNDTEAELFELFKDVGMKYKAKYRSLMFNIKDRKNLSLWQKICDRSITPKQLVRLSPEELASQELAQWRDQEAKHQLELIKKSEIDLLAASKTYVLKTHKGEEVMETKSAVSTELDPTVPVEELVTVLNDATAGSEETSKESPLVNDKPNSSTEKKHGSKKKDKEDIYSRRNTRESQRDSDSRKSRSSRRKSEMKDTKEERTTRHSEKRSRRTRSYSKDRSKVESTKEKADSNERSRRSRSKSKRRSISKSKRRSKSRGRSKSNSRGRSPSSGRSKRRSRSKEVVRRQTRSKHSSSTEEQTKHRSRSQENPYSKEKTNSPGSESIERPKSAMLKEVHPEYDPHEPMITSAFSEEDLRKSRDDIYDDSYRNVMSDYGEDYDPAKGFLIDTNVVLPPLPEKAAEAESDQEPSSTVDNAAAIVWNGCINMVDVARFYVAAHEVSGTSADIEDDLMAELDIVGRINPDTVWEYISKMKRASNKDIIILKLQAANDEEKMQYIALYSYLNSRNRLGVVKVSNSAMVKDFYIVPLPANSPLPSVLLPLDGPGLGDLRTHLLLAIVIRQRKKRNAAHLNKDIIPAKISRPLPYASPLGSLSSTLATSGYTSPALSTSVKDKIAASLASADDEPYSPGSSSSSSSAVTALDSSEPKSQLLSVTSSSLRSKMEELNRQIEEQKQQIRKMTQADSSIGQDEAYSPSRPMTPPSPAAVPTLDSISLPSNLQEILATIKQRENTAADVDMRIQ